MHVLTDLNAFDRALQKEPAFCVFFSTESCNRCTALFPRLPHELQRRFLNLKVYYADMEQHPLVALELRVFASPTLVVYFYGRDSLRETTFADLGQLFQQIETYYNLIDF